MSAAICILDGGLGRELAGRGLDTSDGLWSARALVEQPEVVSAVHADFIEAGADIITANTYAATRRRLDAIDTGAFERFNRAAGELAVRAREAAGRDIRIAGSLPPIHGSYRPDRVRSLDELVPLYREQAGLLADYVDVFICETMSTAEEARAAATGAAETGRPVWVSWTVADDGSGRLRSGESVREAVAALDGIPVETLLFNCSMPESIEAALPALVAEAGRPFGAYANAFSAIAPGFDVADGANAPPKRTELDPDTYLGHARRWLALGAGVIGGCCEVGPAHIARLRAGLGKPGGSG